MKFFSREEVRDILVSVLVLTIVFSYPEFLGSPYFLLVSFLAVGIAFMGHELAHKFTAIRYGLWSEYRMWSHGLLMALLFALATNGSFIFAAPGAVYFASEWAFSRPGKRELRNISMAGISFNIALMWSTLALLFLTGLSLFGYIAIINGWLAVFNLIPFGGLDGAKLFRLDRNAWTALFMLALAGFVILWL